MAPEKKKAIFFLTSQEVSFSFALGFGEGFGSDLIQYNIGFSITIFFLNVHLFALRSFFFFKQTNNNI